MTAIKFERLQLFRFYVPIFALFESDDLESTTRLIFHIPCLSKTSKISFTQNYLQRLVSKVSKVMVLSKLIYFKLNKTFSVLTFGILTASA